MLQPILVRPQAGGQYQIVAGERRWRASQLAGLTEIPVIIEELDDEAALEIAIIENLQREDISPLEEAEMFERMTKEHGYSLRKLATKLGKDKGYLENRLRLVDAPDDVRELVSVRSDTLSHAYELMKVQDPRKRRRLAKQVASGELSLVKLRQRIEGRPKPEAAPEPEVQAAADLDWETPPEAATETATEVEIEVEEPQQAAYVAIPIEPEGLAVDDPTIDDAATHLEDFGEAAARGPRDRSGAGRGLLFGTPALRQAPDAGQDQAGERHRRGPRRGCPRQQRQPRQPARVQVGRARGRRGTEGVGRAAPLALPSGSTDA